MRGQKSNRQGLNALRECLRSRNAVSVFFFKTNRLFRKTYRSLQFVEEEVVDRGIRAVFVRSLTGGKVWIEQSGERMARAGWLKAETTCRLLEAIAERSTGLVLQQQTGIEVSFEVREEKETLDRDLVEKIVESYGLKEGEQRYILKSGQTVTRKVGEKQQPWQRRLETAFNADAKGNAPDFVQARLRTGPISASHQEGSRVNDDAQAWIATFPSPYNITHPGSTYPTSSSGHVLGRRFGGVGALGNIAPLRPDANAGSAKIENDLANLLAPFNASSNNAVCVTVVLLYTKGATPDARIPAWIFISGLVVLPTLPGLPEAPPIVFPIPPIKNS